MNQQNAAGRGRKGVVFLIALILTLLSIIVVFPMLNPAVAYPNIVSLELARFAGEDGAQQIIDLWQRDQRIELAKQNVWFDYVFIVCYTTVFYLACRWATSEFNKDSYHLAGIVGHWLVVPGQLVAGGSDAIENVFLLLMLQEGARNNSYPLLACTFATVKFVLLLIGLLYVIVAAARALARATAR